MSTQVIGSVNELEGPVSIMRDGESRSLAAGDSIMAGDVITASDSGRASIVLSSSYGEPIGNLLIAPTGSVIVDTTMKDGQTALALHVVQGERDLVADCRSLARFELRGLPPAVAGALHIRVSFQIDADGLLSVSAREQSSGVEAHIEVKPSYGLGDEQIASMLQDAIAASQSDMRLRALREAQIDARRLLDATESALAEDGGLLSPTEIEAIHQAMYAVADRLDDRQKIGLANDVMHWSISNLLHGEQGFTFHRMAYAGDVLRFEQRIEDIYDKKGGALEFVLRKTRVSNQRGEHVADLRAVTVLRHGVSA